MSDHRKREQIVDGMSAIIHRTLRLGNGNLVLIPEECSVRELSIKLLSFVLALDPEIDDVMSVESAQAPHLVSSPEARMERFRLIDMERQRRFEVDETDREPA